MQSATLGMLATPDLMRAKWDQISQIDG
jgi:hypothetical protein